VTGWALRWRPRWVYASEWLACPIVLVLRILLNVNVIYHEHDSPASRNGSWSQRTALATRRILARRARACVLPNQRRAEMFARDVRDGASVMCVWNCPTRDEVASPRAVSESGDLWVLYHGSITPGHLPISVLKALTMLPDDVKLRIVGYETVGHRGYVGELREAAFAFGIARRVDFVGAVPRHELLTGCRRCDVGIAFMPRLSSDINEQNMVGASNKPFDYMASGLALLVSELPEWRAVFADDGYGLACDSDDATSIAAAIRWFVVHRDEMRRMGERGRQRVLAEWNYETQFAPVLECILGSN
jgi:glycosyltransferase involved in cell wall biosynthesis